MLKEGKENLSFLDLISGVASSAIVLGGFLYVGGWSYLYQYYRSFGLELSDVEVPVYDALIYSLPVIFNGRLYAFIIFSIILVIGLIFHSRWIRSKLPIAISLLFIIILLTTYGLSRYGAKLGNARALTDMMRETSDLPDVAIQVDSEGSEINNEVIVELNKLEFKLLAHKKGQYFIFRPFKGKSMEEGANIQLIVIPESRVQMIRILRGVK